MRILCVTPWFPKNKHDQTGNFILDSIESLVAMGHHVVVLVTEPWRPYIAKFFDKKWSTQTIAVDYLPKNMDLYQQKYISIPKNYFKNFSHNTYKILVGAKIKKLIKQYQIDVIHAHTELAGMAICRLGKDFGLPTIVTLHGISTDKTLYKKKIRKALFEATLSQVDQVILVGQPLVNFYQRFVKTTHHFKVIANGFRMHPKCLEMKMPVWKTNLTFISVSNLYEQKGIHLNLQALAKLKNSGFNNWQYKIIGDGPERKNLSELTQQLNLSDHVIFYGACPHNQVYEQLDSANIFILPSYLEAFGVAYLEAMAFGLLTIGVMGQGPEAFIQNNKTGLLVKPQDVDSLYSAFLAAYTTPKAMQQIARAGQLYVHQHFLWSHHARELTKVFTELTSLKKDKYDKS